MSCDHGYVNPEDCRACDRAADWEQADSLSRIATALEQIAGLLAAPNLTSTAPVHAQVSRNVTASKGDS